jgi:phosphopantothenoylcysteine decarboxylase/phosphopantothenate--cysteine ligase
MAEPEKIFARAQKLLSRASDTSLQGKTVVVTAGGTREPIDAVRFVGNRSSGRMGAAIAAEARRRGAEVTLIAANMSVDEPAGVEVVQTPTAADLARETLARADADVIVMAAAVADYRPAEPMQTKRPKDDDSWRLELEPTDDVLRALTAQDANGRIVVGFAAETGEDGLARAREKRAVKQADLFVYNDVGDSGIGFDSAQNEVVIISDEGERHVARAPKERVAAEILDDVERLLGRNGGRAAG